jgi:VCBS repeat protein/K319-like protein
MMEFFGNGRGVAALVGLLLVAVAPASAQPLTTARDDFASSLGARGITFADFNRDGWVDIATSNEGPHGVAVLLNRGSAGGFTQSFIALPGGPFDIEAGDLNKDSVPDIAVANADGNQINVMFGRASGGFTTPLQIGANGNPRDLTLADMDGDGNLDIVYTLFNFQGVQILHGDGAGTFRARMGAATVAVNPQGIVAGDFNLDGRLDLAVASNAAPLVTLLFQTAAGTFSRQDVPGRYTTNVLATGDFNKDGHLDLAAASTSGAAVEIYLGVAGGLAYAAAYPTGPQPRGLAAADLNRDGRLDIITGNRASATVSVLTGNADGTFAAGIELAAGGGSRVVAAADFDNDGRVDIATGNEYAASVTVLSNTTTFERIAYAFHRKTLGTPSNTGMGVASIGVADFDHDGRLDVATQNWPRGFVTLLANGKTTLTAADTAIGRIKAARLNGDAHADVVAATGNSLNVGSVIMSFLGDGTGSFPNSTASQAGIVVAGYRLADMNRDGRLDLLAFGYTPGDYYRGEVQLLPGRGDGGFSTGVRIPLRKHTLGIAVGDVNRDGALDFVTYYQDCCEPGALAEIYTGSGGGTFNLSQTVHFNEWPYMGGAGLADVDSDGYLDLVATSYVRQPNGQPAYRIGTSRGSAAGFGEPQYGQGPQPDQTVGGGGIADLHPEGLADLNLDGRVDVFGNGADLLLGNGDGTFGAPEGFVANGIMDVLIVDFDGDGLPDVVYPGYAGSVLVLLNQRQADNTSPAVDAGEDLRFPYDYQFDDYPLSIWASGSDADLHRLAYEWRDADGNPLGTDATGDTSRASVELPPLNPGSYEFTVTVTDGRGGVARDSVIVTILPMKEMVLHVGQDYATTRGNWEVVTDSAAASSVRIHDRNAGAPKVTTALANPPTGWADIGFVADPTQTYKLWVRLKADDNHWANDSVWIQMTGAVDSAGRPIGAPGTTGGIEINLEECSGCGVSGWGWRDEAWGAKGATGTMTLRFPQGGHQWLRFQTREDGVSVDQFVLSAEQYLTTRPGAVKNDTVILPPTLVWQRY